jgi:hypothetical protein
MKGAAKSAGTKLAKPAKRVQKVAREVMVQARDAGRAAIDEAKSLGERVSEATSDLVERVT